MLYEFVAKIKNVKNKGALDSECIGEFLQNVNIQLHDPMSLNFAVRDAEKSGDILVKADVSISTMAYAHEVEVERAVESFIAYLEEIEKEVDGEISRSEGFYNNTKIFKKLFD